MLELRQEYSHALCIVPLCLDGALDDKYYASATTIYALYDLTAVSSCGFTPRMVGSRIIKKNKKVVHWEIIVDTLTWRVPQKPLIAKMYDLLTELRSNRSLIKDKLQANAVAYYNLNGDLLTLQFLDTTLYAVGEGSTWVLTIPKPAVIFEMD